MKIQTFVEHFDEPLYLESGRILETYDLKYEMYGEMNEDKSNVIIVFHALTGSHHAAGRYEPQTPRDRTSTRSIPTPRAMPSSAV